MLTLSRAHTVHALNPHVQSEVAAGALDVEALLPPPPTHALHDLVQLRLAGVCCVHVCESMSCMCVAAGS